MDWWNNVIITIKSYIKKSDIDPKEIAGIGVSGMVLAFFY
jgi:ribulose kinase